MPIPAPRRRESRFERRRPATTLGNYEDDGNDGDDDADIEDGQVMVMVMVTMKMLKSYLGDASWSSSPTTSPHLFSCRLARAPGGCVTLLLL